MRALAIGNPDKGERRIHSAPSNTPNQTPLLTSFAISRARWAIGFVEATQAR